MFIAHYQAAAFRLCWLILNPFMYFINYGIKNINNTSVW